MKKCNSCGIPMPSKRVELGYCECTECSSVESYGFVNIINHKTGNTVQPMPQAQAAAINKMGDRKRFGTVLKGGSKSDTYNPKNIKFGASTNFVGSEAGFERVGSEALYLLESKGYDSALEFVKSQSVQLTISGSQAFQIKQILQTIVL